MSINTNSRQAVQSLEPIIEAQGERHVVLAQSTVRLPDKGRATVELDPAIRRLLNNPLAIVGLLAVVGPLGLPALWLSKRFSRITKIVTTIVFLLVTVVLPLATAYYWLEIALRPLADVMHQTNQ